LSAGIEEIPASDTTPLLFPEQSDASIEYDARRSDPAGGFVSGGGFGGTLGAGCFPPSQFAFDGREQSTIDDVRRIQGLRFIPELARR
jgi:hypothetical protein